MKFYVTFGQNHVHKFEHATLDRNRVLEFEAKDEKQAKEFCLGWFGDLYCAIRSEMPNMNFYTGGLVKIPVKD